MSGLRPRLVLLPPRTPTLEEWAADIAAAVPAIEVRLAADRADALRLLPDAEAAFGVLDPELLAAAPRLRWLQAPMAAPDPGFYFDALVAHPVEVTNFRGLYNDHVATHAVAMLLALARGLPRYMRQQARAEWERRIDPAAILHLPEATTLVIGVGGVGEAIGAMLRPYGGRILGVDPRRLEAPPAFDALHRPDELDALLPAADAVILTLPHTPESEGMFDAARFSRMKPGAFLVNIGRGPTVRLDAVVAALESGRLGAVALDVFEQEPLPAGHPLWRSERALLTPHVAVVGPYLEARRLGVLRENARRFAAGEALLNPVDKALWY